MKVFKGGRISSIINSVKPLITKVDPIKDTDFAQRLFSDYNVTVLPGRFLARDTHNGNPGENYVRMALVASLEECVEAAKRIRSLVLDLKVD